MFHFSNTSKLVFCLSIAAFGTGCGTTATITRPGLPEVEAKIQASDSQNIYVENAAGTTTIDRQSITDIDHPGNVAATIGAIVTGYGIANIALGAPDCDRGGAAYCFGVFLPAAIGAPIMGWGIATWLKSVQSAGPRKEKTEPSFAVVPVLSVDKKNEYVGASAVMRF
jgi:hypothetical protein